MKTKQHRLKLFLLLLAPLFINGICNKEDVETPKADQYVTWNFTGQSGELTSPTDSLDIGRVNNSTYIYATPKSSSNNSFFITFDGPQAAGTYSSSQCSLILSNNDYNQTNSPVQVIVTEYGSIGGYVTGTYSGTLIRSSNNASISVTGQFRVKRR